MKFKFFTATKPQELKVEIQNFIDSLDYDSIIDIKITANKWDWVAVVSYTQG